MINSIVDLYSGNKVQDLGAAKASGISAIIHKATEGLYFVDVSYQQIKNDALSLNLHWGAYHFGIAGDGVTQAQHFLNTVQPAIGELLVLDFESTRHNNNMTLDDAQRFVSHIHQETGIWPGLYSNPYFLQKMLNTTSDPIFKNCWLWVAEYGPAPSLQNTWSQWELWQYTDGIHGPDPTSHNVPGIGICDRSRFRGNENELKAFWENNSIPNLSQPTIAEVC
jgi:lysozyme